MKKLGLAGAALAVIAVVAFFQLPCGMRAQAMSGCCMFRNADTDSWRIIHQDFDQCSRANTNEDLDSIFKETGKYWWNALC